MTRTLTTTAPRRSVCALIALMILATAFSAVPDAARAADAQLVVEADRLERELYRDETAITLTVTAPKDCVEIIVSQLGGTEMIYGDWLQYGAQGVYANIAEDPLYYTKEYKTLSFTAENAAVTGEGDERTWTLVADFGIDGVYGLLVTARMASGTELTAKVPVYIRYPSINIVNDGVSAAWETYILRDSDEPFYFVLDLAQTALEYRNVSQITDWGRYVEYTGSESVYCSEIMIQPDRRMLLFGEDSIDPWSVKRDSDSPVYGEMVLWNSIPFDLRLYARSEAGEFTWVNDIDTMCFPVGDYVLCGIAETEFERITCSARAAVCYLRGGHVNADLYPEAAVCFERASAVLAEILTPGMTDFEKVKAVHDWMWAEGKNLSLPEDYDQRTPEEHIEIMKTAYGFMSGFGGDCMGWSDTFYMLCSMAGVSCSPVSACAEAGGATDEQYSADHRLNIAFLDGEAYYFDVFWDAAGSAYSVPPYTYFCMTSEQAAKSHTWSAPVKFGPPEAASTTYAVDAATGDLLAE